MARDGVPPEVIVETLRPDRDEPYEPKGGWRV
jgi:hypothetical protein